MTDTPVIIIFDIGKTNKKVFLVNTQYKIVFERAVQFPEIEDEDGFPCEDIEQVSQWVKQTFTEVAALPGYDVKAINFSAYGASFVHVSAAGEIITPLYNYLKPYPPEIHNRFYQTYGSELTISLETASPVLGSLNSGMQLYCIKNKRREVYDEIQYSLHLPQYFSWLITGTPCAEITSIGCHTMLWNFSQKMYHNWVYEEEMDQKFPAVLRSNATLEVLINDKKIKCGIGLHDSSAALIPYLACFSDPFILISTGTWCISLNPFIDEALTADELKQDCLCYLEYHGRPVKASRLFAGHEHEEQIKILAKHFAVAVDYYQSVAFDGSLFDKISNNENAEATISLQASAFSYRELSHFSSYEEAYHQLIHDIIQQQKKSTSLVLSAKKIDRIFVDGGFAKNVVYMHMLAAAFPSMQVYAAFVSQATAIGAALVIHSDWNPMPVPKDMVVLKKYEV